MTDDIKQEKETHLGRAEGLTKAIINDLITAIIKGGAETEAITKAIERFNVLLKPPIGNTDRNVVEKNRHEIECAVRHITEAITKIKSMYRPKNRYKYREEDEVVIESRTAINARDKAIAKANLEGRDIDRIVIEARNTARTAINARAKYEGMDVKETTKMVRMENQLITKIGTIIEKVSRSIAKAEAIINNKQPNTPTTGNVPVLYIG
ncbi:MAG: hypothetical protein KAJ40_00770 [Alphaproteobacteria bacterium]|nr:hypothetical protein [Alphaproteobacteria bacterium]